MIYQFIASFHSKLKIVIVDLSRFCAVTYQENDSTNILMKPHVADFRKTRKVILTDRENAFIEKVLVVLFGDLVCGQNACREIDHVPQAGGCRHMRQTLRVMMRTRGNWQEENLDKSKKIVLKNHLEMQDRSMHLFPGSSSSRWTESKHFRGETTIYLVSD